MRLVVGGGHHGFVDGQAALLRLLDRLEHALVVARHDLDEAPLGLFPAHEQPRGHRALRVADVPGEEILHEEDVFGVDERLEVDHAGIAAPLEVAGGVEDVRDAARHARGEVATALPDDDDASPRHVLAAVVAHALDHGEGPAVAYGKTLPGHSAEVRLAARGAVEDDVAHQDVLLGHEGRLARRIDDELAAREALADVVVGIALEGQRDAPGHEGAEALARRAREVDADRVVGQAVRTMAPRQLRAQDRSYRAVDVADGQADVHGL